jgi:TolB protein
VAVPTATNTPTTEEVLEALQGKILFKTDRAGRVEIYQMNADGTEQNPLGADYAYLYNEAIRWESFSADRNQTIVVRGEGQVDLWLVDLVAGGDLRITTDGAADYDPVWSPLAGDDRIVFVSERTGRSDLYILALNGSGVRRLTNNEDDFDKHPSWSPEGRYVTYWSDQGWQKNPQIWRLDLDIGETISLSNNPFKDWDPVWVK